jgi:ubiquinone/menaquinone biosynthesis C-methylase UbiE
MSEAERLLRETRDNWATRAGNWNAWAERLERQQRGLNEPLLEVAGIGPGMACLDLASGTGEPALSIAAAVGPLGRVIATDLVAEMLAGARRRAAGKGLANMTFEVADMQALPFEDASFDRVTCRLGLMYVPEPARAAAEARRVLKPGGRAAFLCWGRHEENDQFQVLDEVLWNEMRIDPHEGPFAPTRFGDEGALAALLLGAGFARAEERHLTFNPRIDPATKFWQAQVALRLGDRLHELSDVDRGRLDAAMARAFERYRDGDRVSFRTAARIGIGDR